MEDTKLLTWLIIVTLVISVIFGFLLLNKKIVAEVPSIELPPVTATISDQDKTDIVNSVVAQIPEPVVNTPIVYEDENGEPVQTNDGSYTLNKGEYEAEQTEAKAEELALEELSTKDFKKELVNFFELHEVDVESYRDIEEVVVKDTNVDVDNEDATVEFELKISYFEDGDDDEEDLVKAKILVTFEIEDLNFDEEFEDAEVVEYCGNSFELIKFYD